MLLGQIAAITKLINIECISSVIVWFEPPWGCLFLISQPICFFWLLFVLASIDKNIENFENANCTGFQMPIESIANRILRWRQRPPNIVVFSFHFHVYWIIHYQTSLISNSISVSPVDMQNHSIVNMKIDRGSVSMLDCVSLGDRFLSVCVCVLVWFFFLHIILLLNERPKNFKTIWILWIKCKLN